MFEILKMFLLEHKQKQNSSQQDQTKFYTTIYISRDLYIKIISVKFEK